MSEGDKVVLSWSHSCESATASALQNANLHGAPVQDFLRERERELRKEGREVPSRVRLREGPIGVRITLGQPTIG